MKVKEDPINKKVMDVTILQKDDVVYYHNLDNGKYLIDEGVVKEDNLYVDGVDVYGDGWRQYVGKWFICKVERNGEVIFDQEDGSEELD